ncbi:metallophosphoesterase [Clostridium sp. WILCCON 0269]|uniref:Metallophosphoesterase n=1 Tax=Candidatus Clostridium eludens TaxID=3381663 RepID=A0ABW8SGM1_9CLOT
MAYYTLISIFIILFGLLNYYAGLWAWQLLGMTIPLLNPKIYWIVFSLIVICVIVGIIANRFLPYFLRGIFYIIGSYWIAALSYFILSIVIVKIIAFFNIWNYLSSKVTNNNSILTLSSELSVITLIIILLIYGTFNAKKLKVTTYNININKEQKIFKKLRIVMISDIHISNINDHRQNKIIHTINQLKPDIVLITGDIIDDIVPFIKEGIVNDFHKINSKYGVYACLGNHDYQSGDLSYVLDILNKSGINVLRDSCIKIADSFYIIGREDKSYEMMSRKKRMELSKLTEGINHKLPVIMLDHQPINIDEAENMGVDLQLSGHTHKGQFFPFNFITNKMFKVHYGYLKTGKLQVIVSCGASTWGPPIRIGSTSEVVNVIVEFKKSMFN